MTNLVILEGSLPPMPDEVRAYCPHLTDKLLVDYVNGLQVARQKTRYQKDNGGFVARTWGAITGSSARRQQQVNEHLADGLEAALGWLTDLTQHQARTDLAVAALGQAIDSIAIKLGETRNAVVALDYARQANEARLAALSQEVARQDFRDRADDQLELVMASWEGGKFNDVPLLTQVFIVFDQLYWGEFGHYCRAHPERGGTLRQRAAEKAKAVCRASWGLTRQEKDRIIPTPEWLAISSSIPPGDLQEAIACMGDWSEPADEPLAWTATRYSGQATLPLSLPRVLKTQQVSDRLCHEVLVRERWQGKASLVGGERW